MNRQDAAARAVSCRPSWLRRSGTWLAEWIRTCFDHYAAAATYEELSRLSDPELRRRGLDRSTLAQELIEKRTRRSWR